MTGSERWPLSADPASIEMAIGYARGLTRHAPRFTDDAIGAALFGLLDAERTFDPSAGSSWMAHAKKRAWGAVMDELRKQGQHGFTGLTGRHVDSPDPLTFDAHPVHDDRIDISRSDARLDSQVMLACCKDKESDAIEATVMGGAGRASYALSVGCCGTWVTHLVNSGIAKMARRFGGLS